MKNKKINTQKLSIAAMFLAIAVVLPFITGQIPQIGNALCPMHFPVILCGFFCGPWYGLVVGFISPILRFLLFGVPQIFPKGIIMCLELATYGFVSAILFKILPKKKLFIYVSLVLSMLSGRIVWGIAKAIFYGLENEEFGISAFITGGFINAAPGIIIQIILIPIIVITLQKYTYRTE